MQAFQHALITFEDVKVPVKNLIDAENVGSLPIMQQMREMVHGRMWKEGETM